MGVREVGGILLFLTVAELVVIVSAELPEPSTDAGSTVAIVPFGDPLTSNVAVPAKSFSAVTVTV